MRICKREGCENSLEGKRSYAKWCSSRCQSNGWHRDNPEKRVLNNVRTRARKQGLPFDLDYEDVIAPETCPVLGIPLERSTGATSPNSPSVDRLIPELGYVRGNVRVISARANQIKHDATPEEVQAVADWMKENVPCPSSS